MDLDSLIYGGPLGAEPLHTDLKNAKLRFGPLEGSGQGLEGRLFGNGKEIPHVAFGFEKRVGRLRKWSLYIWRKELYVSDERSCGVCFRKLLPHHATCNILIN
jgi:hypothetical protein